MCRFRFAVLFGCVFLPALAHTQDLPVYDDALQNNFEDFSYGTPGSIDFANATPTQAGALSIRLTGDDFNAVSFAHPGGAFSTAQYRGVRLWLHGGSVGNQQLRVYLQLNDVVVAQAELDSYISGGALAAGQWRLAEARFDQGPLLYAGNFDRIDVQSDIAGAQPALYIDDVDLTAAGGGGIPVLSDGFESPSGAPVQPPMLIEPGVVVDSMTSDRFSWRDSDLQPRVAVLAHNTGQVGPAGTRGGEMREFRYETPGGTRIVRAAGSLAAGFGYVVSHRAEGTTDIAGGDSPLGHDFSGSFVRVFSGRHHAIFRFNQNYPRYSRTTAAPPNTLYQVPVSIDWMFSTGLDHPLWAITWDASGVPVNALEDDSRAPYGELLFDGAASAGAHSELAGVGWGDRYKFASTSAPLSYNSSWSWNAPNTIPYVKLWTTAVDATMGTVLTQTIEQQDAGGYFGVSRWDSTSASGNACTVAIGGVAHLMPCDFNWPYQSVNYSLNPFAPNTTTNNTRLAWGTNFGFLGQAQYLIHGSAFYGGPLPDTTASGWPRKSYSNVIVLGRNSVDPVAAQVTRIETIQGMSITASVGSVAADGPAGVGRPDTVNYNPPGYDPVYSVFALIAAGDAVDVMFNLAAGTLKNPLIVIRNYAAATAPTRVRWNGQSLLADADYFASLRATEQELWITLNRGVTGAGNRLQVNP